ncbi:MAG: pre-peptidase C-terminal domain-containing protein, partial [Tepidisphaeraceae bacterium]
MMCRCKSQSRRWYAALCVLLLATTVRAASPVLTSVLPRGGQRGAEVELVFAGDRLADAQEVIFYTSGLSVKKLEAATPQQLKIKVAIASDAALGEHPLRVRTATGISELRTFWVGALPVVEEKEPNSDFAQPQKIELNTTIAGVIDNEDVDYFIIEAKKGQCLTVDVEGIRLGDTMFDPYVAIFDKNRFELAACDDSPLLLQDPVASITAPGDDQYIVQVRESAYGGNASCRYRLHIGTFPRPRVAFPAGGQAGKELATQLIGDASGPIAQTISLPAEPGEFRLVVDRSGQTPPSPNYLRVSPFANALEAEPNDEGKTATIIPGPLPAAANGVVASTGDVDHFRITAKAGQVFDLSVYARRLRSPLDPVLAVFDATGKVLAENDDTNGPDSYLRFAVPADGEYIIRVHDQLHGGGPQYVYRVEMVPVQPRLDLSIPLIAANSQERQAIVVPRGNRFATLVRATRADFAGEVKLKIDDLPPGVTVTAEPVAANLDLVP